MMAPLPNRSLPSVRGLIPLHNRGGQSFRLADLHRWVNLFAHGYAIKKIDLMGKSFDVAMVENLLAYAREFQVGVSIRTAGETLPPDLKTLAAAGLVDVMLTPVTFDALETNRWLIACAKARLPVRLQLPLASLNEDDIARARALGVKSVTFSEVDPFVARAHGTVEAETLAALDELNVEVNLLLLDATFSSPAWRGHVVHPDWQHLEPVFYHREALAWAVARYEDSPRRVRAMSLLAMTRLSQLDNPADSALMLLIAKYARFLQGPVTFLTKGFRLATWRDTAEAGAPMVDSGGGAPRKRYLDPVDKHRVDLVDARKALAERALSWQQTRQVDRVFDSTQWHVENAFFERLLGVNKIRTVSSRPLNGSRLPWLQVPFMVTATFGGGLAEGIGFGAGRHLRLCCPMADTTHQITLFVDEHGDYVLLRDGQVVTPLDFGGRFCVPVRMPDALHLHIQAFNVDESLAVTSVRVWEGEAATLAAPDQVKWSVVIFSTRFARRLQAVLLALAHQRDVDLSAIEVIVGYVPGVDGTEDTLDSIRLAHPELRIVHASFPEHNLKSKGFVLNEAMTLAAGSWIVILDSDIIVPPDFFSALAREDDANAFLAPTGRAMLEPAQTAQLLTGEARSWEDWEALAKSAPEFRAKENEDGVPVGYCQVFRRECLEKVKYPEYEHFQGADYEFGAALIRHFGPVRRLDLSVLHLHHGGRQWYGTQKHY